MFIFIDLPVKQRALKHLKMKKNRLSLTNLHIKSFVTSLDDPHAKTVKSGASDNAACGSGAGGGGDDNQTVRCTILDSDGVICAALTINPACPSEQTCQETCITADQPQNISWGGG